MEISRTTAILLTLAFAGVAHSARWEANLGWCTGGNKLFLGDFNGDGKTDFLCHRPSDGYKWTAFANANGQFTGTNWQQGMRWCYHAGAEIHIGDFDGDGRSDMLCHDTNDGPKWVTFANSNGDFSGRTSWKAYLGWCNHGGAELHIGDFNGDGRDDMLCHDRNNGYKWIAYASSCGSFVGTNWERGIGWCYHSGSQLFIGDFNGDFKDDLLCHDNTGHKWIAYANSAGNFNNSTGWEQAGWCRHSDAELYVGNFNGDRRDDLLCHDSGTGKKWVSLANRQGNFNGRTSWEASLGWCYHSTAEFHVGDFNGDYETDMLCHDTSSGKKWIIYAEFQFTVNSIFQ